MNKRNLKIQTLNSPFPNVPVPPTKELYISVDTTGGMPVKEEKPCETHMRS